MGYRRGSGQKFQRARHDKAKRKSPKSRSSSNQIFDETPDLSASEIAEKTAVGLSKLGTQIFALSPFSQYYDDWLVSLRQIIAEFESSPAVTVDEAFTKERTQIFVDLERELVELKLKEGQMGQAANALADNNHLLGDADAEYARQTRELSLKRNDEISPLTKKVHDLEAELEKTKQMKTSIFGFTKKAKAKKEAEINQTLVPAKAELEVAVQNFNVEQEKLHDEYEKKKQDLMDKIRGLEKEITGIETDSSAQPRQIACNALTHAVNELV